MTIEASVDELAASRGGAKALVMTVLGEFVLPGDGSVWTTTLVAAAGALGVGEKNARQAIARIGEQGLIASSRHGRSVRWVLTDAGREMLESGARRIYEFGTSSVEWQGEWLVAHCPVPESRRALRHQLRTRLGFLGFGELSANLLVSPHVDREPSLRAVLDELGLDGIVWRSSTASAADDADLVAKAWDLERLADSYAVFSADHVDVAVTDGESAFRALVALVHDWRRFPFIDPELPTEFLPAGWEGSAAASLFADRRDAWSTAASDWFAALDAGRGPVS